MSDRKLGKVAKTLIEVKKLIGDECNWCQDRYTQYNINCSEYQYCAMGAIRHVTKTKKFVSETPEAKFLSDVCDELHHMRVTAFNDISNHAQVLGLLDVAIMRAINNPYAGYEQRDLFNDGE